MRTPSPFLVIHGVHVSDLTPLSLHLFKNETDSRTLLPGDVLFEEGDEGDQEMFVVLEGELDVKVKDRLVETVGPGGVIGELGILEKAPRSATVVARTGARVAPISTQRFEFLVQQTPYFATHLMRIMAARLRRTDKLL